jgi:hypothetical protein
MGRVARGDEAAFGELVGRYGGRLLGVARRLLGSRADAEDAVQRALLQCYLGAGTYRSEWAVSGKLSGSFTSQNRNAVPGLAVVTRQTPGEVPGTRRAMTDNRGYVIYALRSRGPRGLAHYIRAR